MSKNTEVMIEADQLNKVYGSFTAIQDITFSCRKGEIVGFLGPNGAGKTTTMRILTGYMPPTSGAAYIAGHHTINESMEARQRLGYLPETVPLYPEMSVEGYLAFVGRLRGIDKLWERIDEVLESVNLLDRAESFIGKLSKGMRQRVGLAQAMLHDPDVLVLDEPTIGLDPRQVVEVRELITQLGKRHTILLSTHILSEVEQICDRVIMVIDGQIWADMPMTQAIGTTGEKRMIVKLAAPAGDTPTRLGQIKGVHTVEANPKNQFTLTIDGRDDTRAQIAETAVHAGWGLLDMAYQRTTLEAVFLEKIKEAEAARMTEETIAEAMQPASEEEEE